MIQVLLSIEVRFGSIQSSTELMTKRLLDLLLRLIEEARSAQIHFSNVLVGVRYLFNYPPFTHHRAFMTLPLAHFPNKAVGERLSHTARQARSKRDFGSARTPSNMPTSSSSSSTLNSRPDQFVVVLGLLFCINFGFPLWEVLFK
jgi:hypothetical protein